MLILIAHPLLRPPFAAAASCAFQRRLRHGQSEDAEGGVARAWGQGVFGLHKMESGVGTFEVPPSLLREGPTNGIGRRSLR